MKRILSVTCIIFTALVAFTSPVNSKDLQDFGRSSKSLFKKMLPFSNTVYDEGAEIILSSGNVLRAYKYINTSDPTDVESQFIVSHEGLIWKCTYYWDSNRRCNRTSHEPMFEVAD